MTHRTTGGLSVSVLAGHIKATSQPIHPEIGQQVSMGDDLHFHITPSIAKQWIGVLTEIAVQDGPKSPESSGSSIE